MSFSFRNLFAQDESAAQSTAGRGENSGAPQETPGVAEYQVSELLPFIPPAIVAQGEIPMDKSIQIILPSDGSNDVRLSTIYQSCPSLFAAEITPLNDSVINLPAKQSQPTVPPPLAGNPFGDAAGMQMEDRATQTMIQENSAQDQAFSALPDNTANAANPFGDPPAVGSAPGNLFNKPSEENASATPQETAPPVQDATADATNPFGDIPLLESAPANPFGGGPPESAPAPVEQATPPALDAAVGPVNPFDAPPAESGLANPFGPPAVPGESSPPTNGNSIGEEAPNQIPVEQDPGAVVFGTDSESFTTLFTQAAREDQTLAAPGAPVEQPPSIETPMDEGNSEYVGPMTELPESPFAGMDGDNDDDGDSGFESFVPPSMEEKPVEEAPEPEVAEFVPPLVQLDESAQTEPENDEDQSYQTFPPMEMNEQPAVEPISEEPTPSPQPGHSDLPEQAKAGDSDDDGFQTFDPTQMQQAEAVGPVMEALEPVAETQKSEPLLINEPEEQKFEAVEPDATAQQEIVAPVKETVPEKKSALQDDVLMTPSGYRIPEPLPSVEDVKAEQAEVKISEPEAKPEVKETMKEAAIASGPTAGIGNSGRTAPVPQSQPFAQTGGMMRDIELRAVFNTEESFTLTKVSQKVAEMDGVVACAIVTPEEVIEDFTDQSDAIGHKIKDMAEHVRCLASVTGVEGASYFTLHMDEVIMSFFFGENRLLGVKHAPDAFKPGTRERLVLVARSLDGLEK